MFVAKGAPRAIDDASFCDSATWRLPEVLV